MNRVKLLIFVILIVLSSYGCINNLSLRNNNIDETENIMISKEDNYFATITELESLITKANQLEVGYNEFSDALLKHTNGLELINFRKTMSIGPTKSWWSPQIGSSIPDIYKKLYVLYEDDYDLEDLKIALSTHIEEEFGSIVLESREISSQYNDHGTTTYYVRNAYLVDKFEPSYDKSVLIEPITNLYIIRKYTFNDDDEKPILTNIESWAYYDLEKTTHSENDAFVRAYESNQEKFQMHNREVIEFLPFICD